ncbi:lipopolysaccharide biosynthesis protein [Methyloceanibacter sp.]|uniref:lipopolysaccharide biosynthesis protein n=1 Tax=Methyloceanibacter sp. TaxID=1965321 RepID=UPI003D6CDBD2
MTLIARLGENFSSASRKGAVSTIANAIASALDLVSFALVARILSPENLGIFLIALSVGTMVERLGSPNFAQTFMRHAVRAIEMRRADDLRRILDIAVLFELGLLTFGLASGLVTAVLVVPSGEHAIFTAVVLTVMLTALRPPLLAVAIPRAFGHHEAVGGWLMLGAMVKVAILALVMTKGGGMIAIAIAFVIWRLISAIGGLAITFRQARRQGALSVKRSDPISFAEWHEDFWPLTRASAITVLPQAVFEFSTPLIGALSGVTNAGLFRLSTKVSEAARIYTNPVAFVVYSEQCAAVERGDLCRFRSQTVRWSLIVGAVTGLGAILFAVAGDFFVDRIFGEGYQAAVPAITWCVVAAVPYSMSTLLQFGLFALAAANQVFRAESVAAILFLAIILALRTPSPEQAAIALAISRTVGLAAYAALFVKALGKRMGAVEGERSQISALDEP